MTTPKKDMVRKLLPDYIDGSARLTPSYDKSQLLKLFKYAHKCGADKVVAEAETLANTSTELINLFEKVKQEPTVEPMLRVFTRVWSGYCSGEKKDNNYLFSKPLIEAFKQSALDIRCDVLPKKFNGYLEIPKLKSYTNPTEDGARHLVESIGAFINIDFNRLSIIMLGSCDGLIGPMYFSYMLSEGATISELLSKDYDFVSKEVPEDLRVFLTAVLYIHHSPDELTGVINEFPRSLKKSTELHKHYTNKPCQLVGKYFKLPPQFSDKWITNRGYFGFRWTGAGRTTLKYVWVNPSKPYQKGV